MQKTEAEYEATKAAMKTLTENVHVFMAKNNLEGVLFLTPKDPKTPSGSNFQNITNNDNCISLVSSLFMEDTPFRDMCIRAAIAFLVGVEPKCNGEKIDYNKLEGKTN